MDERAGRGPLLKWVIALLVVLVVAVGVVGYLVLDSMNKGRQERARASCEETYSPLSAAYWSCVEDAGR